jgi:GNAT superfamily N-acetyltransferase
MAASGVTVAMEHGAALTPVLSALAHLRVTVFRDWPYLYDGNEAYEATFLQTYAKSPEAGIAVARDGIEAIGASSCLPLSDADEDVRTPFEAAGLNPQDFFYFGESVLLPTYRGRGIGVRFFELREARAREVGGARFCTFCAVQRPDDHPLRPAGARGLEEFWAHRGYQRRPDLTASISWKDIDQPDESPKTLVFWMKSLTGEALP